MAAVRGIGRNGFAPPEPTPLPTHVPLFAQDHAKVLENLDETKGLDYDLLAKARNEISKQKRADELQKQRMQKKEKKRIFETLVAKQVWHAVVDTLHPHHTTFNKRMQSMGKAISLGQRIRGATGTFLPGRMAYEFDTGIEQGPQDIPRIVYMAKEDAPAIDTSKKVAPLLPETVVRVRDALQRGLERRKAYKRDKTTGGADGPYVVAQKQNAARHKALDNDNDIFGDVGSYAETCAEIKKAAAEKAAAEKAAAEKAVRENKGSNASASKASSKEVSASHKRPRESEEPPKEVSTTAVAPAAPVDDRRSLRVVKKARNLGDDDAYGDCFPDASLGGARMTTAEEDSDDEDGSKKKRKGDAKGKAGGKGATSAPAGKDGGAAKSNKGKGKGKGGKGKSASKNHV